MPSESTEHALFDIRDCILLAQQFVEGHTLESFTRSRLHFFAATRALEIFRSGAALIARAARSAPAAAVARHSKRGNAYRHRYDNVEEAAVWKTVHVDLPPLLTVIEAELSQLND